MCTAASDSANLLHRVDVAAVDHMGRSELFGQFQATGGDVHRNQRGYPGDPSGHQRAQTHGTGPEHRK
ncbi:hypothetical protein D3C84_1153570 [compost metagenome]